MDTKKIIKLMKDAEKFPVHVRVAAELMRQGVDKDGLRAIIVELRAQNLSQIDLNKLENSYGDLINMPHYFGLKICPRI